MNTKTLVAGVAIAVLAGGAVSAHGNHARASAATYAPPAQPIPYAQLNSYLKAPPQHRGSSGATASTGSATNTAASVPSTSLANDTPSTAVNPPAMSASPGVIASPAANPGTDTTPGTAGAPISGLPIPNSPQ